MTVSKNANPVHAEYYNNEPESIALVMEKVAGLVDEINESIEATTKPVIYLADDAQNLTLIYNALKKYNLDEIGFLWSFSRTQMVRTSLSNKFP